MSLKENDDEVIQIYKDAIDNFTLNNDKENRDKYTDLLFKKFHVQYETDMTEKDPSNHYFSKEFISFREYNNYCEKRYEWKFHTYGIKKYDKPLFMNILIDDTIIKILESFGISIVYKSFSGTEEARVVGTSIDEIEIKRGSYISFFYFSPRNRSFI